VDVTVSEGRTVLSNGWHNKPRCAPGTGDYSQNRDGYEVEQCGPGRGRSEVWLQGYVVGARPGVRS